MKPYALEKRYLIQLLQAVIKEELPLSPPSDLNWHILYKLSAMHYVSNIIYYGIQKLTLTDQLPASVNEDFFKDYKRGIAKEATQHIVSEQILKLFEDNKIVCMPLKGYCIKHLYPSPDMRVLSDIDILIKEEQSLLVNKTLIDIGFDFKRSVNFHEIFHKKPFMNIEIHRRLMKNWMLKGSIDVGTYFENIWDKSKLMDNQKYIYTQAIEDYYIFMIAHLAKHYKHSGIGIRHIVDIWVFQTHYNKSLKLEYLEQEFKKIGLWSFENRMRHLSKVWFDNAKSDLLYDEITDYILDNGAFGTKRNSLRSDLKIKENSFRTSKSFYIIKLLLPSIDRIKDQYPVLEKWPLLLPFYWIIRVFKKRKNAVKKLRSICKTSHKEVSDFDEFIKKTGLE